MGHTHPPQRLRHLHEACRLRLVCRLFNEITCNSRSFWLPFLRRLKAERVAWLRQQGSPASCLAPALERAMELFPHDVASMWELVKGRCRTVILCSSSPVYCDKRFCYWMEQLGENLRIVYTEDWVASFAPSDQTYCLRWFWTGQVMEGNGVFDAAERSIQLFGRISIAFSAEVRWEGRWCVGKEEEQDEGATGSLFARGFLYQGGDAPVHSQIQMLHGTMRGWWRIQGDDHHWIWCKTHELRRSLWRRDERGSEADFYVLQGEGEQDAGYMTTKYIRWDP